MPKAREWVLRRTENREFLASQRHLNPVVARILWARHIDTPDKIHAFLSTDGILGDPLHLADMAQAVERIRRAIAGGEQIAVYGDFDVDGVTATVLLTSVLRLLGARVRPYIPDRFEEGYGLNIDALDHLRDNGVTLCITVDCGVRSLAEVSHAQAHGLDMVITDHHTVADELPMAVANVNPKRQDNTYASTELSGVGVAYQLSRALAEAMSETPEGQTTGQALESYLDLVAVGTIADLAPLEGDNRTMARWGLNRLRLGERLGLSALIAAAGVSLDGVTSTDVAFRLAPRLNAAGRLEHAQIAFQLLMAETQGDADRDAGILNTINRDRQQLLEQQVAQAALGLDADLLPPILVIDGPDYHEGVVGLIASRLRERFYRPTLVLRRGETVARGSARSVDGFHITQALESCRDILIRFGGHAQAAGFTLESAHVEELRERLLAYAQEHLDEAMLTPRLLVDAIVSLDEVTIDTPTAIAQLEPFGKGNPEPLLATRDVVVADVRRIGQTGNHLKLDIVQGRAPRACVAFRQGDDADWLRPGSRVDLAYRPSINVWQNRSSLQLVVEAIRPGK